jgi:hypothetical protein
MFARLLVRSFVGLIVLFVTFIQFAAAAADPLEDGFKSPPASARPHTWWHWMNGNVTREGVTADLEAMKRVGIGGAQIFNASEGIPPGPAKFLSPEWRDLMKFAAQEANRLDIELCLHNCAGWSSSGGPWNTPEHAMQHVVTSEVQCKGPSHFSGTIPAPPMSSGFYRDIVVYAFRTPAGEGVSMKSFAPKITASVEGIDGARLMDGRPGTYVALPVPQTDRPQYIQLEFAQPFTARTFVLTPGTGLSEAKGIVQASDDGQKFRDVREFTLGRRPTRPVSFALGKDPVNARFFRIVFTSVPAGVAEIGPAEVELNPRLRIENIEAKDGDSGGFVLSAPAASESDRSAVVNHSELFNLTSALGADGHLEWDAPPGDWTILRIGYTPTGRINHPAPPEATGLECDKFSKEALDAHWNGFVQKILDDLGPLAGKKPFNNVLIDSYEVGGQNWSPVFRDEFKKRRGYDPLPFLPAFTGRVVDNPAMSERFLWDVRRTIADLFAENYYGHFAELCHQHGLQASIEPYTGPFESLQSGAPADIPMGEFWVEGAPHRSVKLAASVGHIYGRPIIGTESFTARPGPQHGRWLDDPYSIKALGDQIFCQGINRYIFHRYAMQPWTNRWPGMTMGQWGTHFDRTSTWWEQSKPWLQYVARCQYLLQQGRFVADIAYFCGETSPVEVRVGTGDLAPPEGYDYDSVNADVLLNGAQVKDRWLVLKSGMKYRALVLPPDDRNMTPALLGKLNSFLADGLTIIGLRPDASPSLQNYPQCDQEVRQFVSKMWDVRVVPPRTNFVLWGNLGEILQHIGATPDFAFTRNDDARLAYIHRSAGDAEVYFVSNQRDRFETVECSFRISGKQPELWNAETGTIQPAPVWREEGGRTVVPISFDPVGSVFVVFRAPARGDHLVTFRHRDVPSGQSKSELRIVKAVYGVLAEPDKTVDVTDKLAALVKAGELNVPVDNNLAGDPAPNVVKELRVDYSLNGVLRHATNQENETLVFSETPRSPDAPSFALSANADGQPQLWASAPGTFAFEWASGRNARAQCPSVLVPMELSADWRLSFPPNWGAPAEVKLDKLISWPDHSDPGVRFFSGTATYQKDVGIPADFLQADRQLWLDLGVVKNFAEVSLDGKSLGILWKPPFRINLTGIAKAGVNHLEVKVTNLWPNRLIGDEQLPDDREWNGKRLQGWPQWVLDGKPSPTGRFTFTTWHHWTKDDTLRPSGLIGPVTIGVSEQVILTAANAR